MKYEMAYAKYRHEYKYLNNRQQNALLKVVAQSLLHRDSHTGNEDYYRIRSLYFDSPWDKCFYENENGEGMGARNKYRIRIYNRDIHHISLERKSKNGQMTSKHSCLIDETICRQLMSGRGIKLTSSMNAEQMKLISEMQRQAMRPAVIVEYLRYPFIEQNGNVRITFDENITSSNDFSHFLEERILNRPILPMGMSILEVKWDEFLPGYIKKQIQLESLQWCNFSKYYLCRKYNMYGGIRT